MSENITYQNLWDTVNAMLKIKLIVGSPADSVVHVTLDLKVMRSRPTLVIELTWKKKKKIWKCQLYLNKTEKKLQILIASNTYIKKN